MALPPPPISAFQQLQSAIQQAQQIKQKTTVPTAPVPTATTTIKTTTSTVKKGGTISTVGLFAPGIESPMTRLLRQLQAQKKEEKVTVISPAPITPSVVTTTKSAVATTTALAPSDKLKEYYKTHQVPTLMGDGAPSFAPSEEALRYMELSTAGGAVSKTGTGTMMELTGGVMQTGVGDVPLGGTGMGITKGTGLVTSPTGDVTITRGGAHGYGVPRGTPSFYETSKVEARKESKPEFLRVGWGESVEVLGTQKTWGYNPYNIDPAQQTKYNEVFSSLNKDKGDITGYIQDVQTGITNINQSLQIIKSAPSTSTWDITYYDDKQKKDVTLTDVSQTDALKFYNQRLESSSGYITDYQKSLNEINRNLAVIGGYKEGGWEISGTESGGYSFGVPKASKVVKYIYGGERPDIYIASELGTLGFGTLASGIWQAVTGQESLEAHKEATAESILGTTRRPGESIEAYTGRFWTSPKVISEIYLPIISFGAGALLSEAVTVGRAGLTGISTRIGATGAGKFFTPVTETIIGAGKTVAPYAKYLGGSKLLQAEMKYGLYAVMEAPGLIETYKQDPLRVPGAIGTSLYNWELIFGTMGAGARYGIPSGEQAYFKTIRPETLPRETEFFVTEGTGRNIFIGERAPSRTVTTIEEFPKRGTLEMVEVPKTKGGFDIPASWEREVYRAGRGAEEPLFAVQTPTEDILSVSRVRGGVRAFDIIEARPSVAKGRFYIEEPRAGKLEMAEFAPGEAGYLKEGFVGYRYPTPVSRYGIGENIPSMYDSGTMPITKADYVGGLSPYYDVGKVGKVRPKGGWAETFYSQDFATGSALPGTPPRPSSIWQIETGKGYKPTKYSVEIGKRKYTIDVGKRQQLPYDKEYIRDLIKEGKYEVYSPLGTIQKDYEIIIKEKRLPMLESGKRLTVVKKESGLFKGKKPSQFEKIPELSELKVEGKVVTKEPKVTEYGLTEETRAEKPFEPSGLYEGEGAEVITVGRPLSRGEAEILRTTPTAEESFYWEGARPGLARPTTVKWRVRERGLTEALSEKEMGQGLMVSPAEGTQLRPWFISFGEPISIQKPEYLEGLKYGELGLGEGLTGLKEKQIPVSVEETKEIQKQREDLGLGLGTRQGLLQEQALEELTETETKTRGGYDFRRWDELIKKTPGRPRPPREEPSERPPIFIPPRFPKKEKEEQELLPKKRKRQRDFIKTTTRRKKQALIPDILSATISQARFGKATAPKESGILWKTAEKKLFLRSPTLELMQKAGKRIRGKRYI